MACGIGMVARNSDLKKLATMQRSGDRPTPGFIEVAQYDYETDELVQQTPILESFFAGLSNIKVGDDATEKELKMKVTALNNLATAAMPNNEYSILSFFKFKGSINANIDERK